MKTGFQFIPESRPLQYLPALRILWTTPSAPNTSLYDYPLELWSTIPETELIVKLCVFVPVIVFGLLGNSILLEIIFSNSTLRTPSHFLIANLVVTDFLTLLVCPIFFMTHDFFQNYLLGPIGCKLEGLIEGGLLVTSVLGMCVISYDRLSAVVLPAGTRLQERGAAAAIAFCWVMGFLIALPLSLYRHFKVRYWKNLVEMYCYEDRTVLASYWEFLLVMLVWLPLGVMLVAYSLIIIKLDRYERKALRRQHPMVVRYKSRVAKTLYIVLLGFIVVRVPFTILVFVYYNIEPIESVQFSDRFIFSWWLAKVAFIFLNAAINPLIYGLTNKAFKKALRGSKIVQCLCRLPPEEECTGDTPIVKVPGCCCCFGNETSPEAESSQAEGFQGWSRFSRVRRLRETWFTSTLKEKRPKQETSVDDKS